MSKIVLVHGALHGAWCWETLTPHLRAHGFDVEAVELPGAGADTTAASDITFDSAVKLVADALHDEPTILLGHSMGGFIASQAAVLAPHHVNNLVLLCAAAPADGETLIDQAKLLQQWHTHSGPDESSILRASREAPSLGLWRDIFYNECSIDIATAAVARFRPTPPAFQQHAISLPADTWSKVSKTYARRIAHCRPSINGNKREDSQARSLSRSRGTTHRFTQPPRRSPPYWRRLIHDGAA